MSSEITSRSIRQRLFLSSVALFALVGLFCWISFLYIFEQSVERYTHEQLDEQIEIAVSSLKFDEAGGVVTGAGLSRPEYNVPFSGFYWQINDETGRIDGSPSLLDFDLALPPTADPSRYFEYAVPGPQGQDLILARQLLPVPREGARTPVQLAIAVSHAEVSRLVDEYAARLALVFGVVALVAAALIGLQIAYVTRPLLALLPQIENIRLGRSKRMPERQPSEIAPLAQRLNALLDQQETVLERSRARAAALAHGLKTPLAAIMGETRRLPAADAARRIESQIDRINQSVHRELVRTRIRGAAHGVSRTNYLAPMVDDVIEAQKRLPRGDQLDWRNDTPEDATVTLDTEDLAEIVGNLLDNARKWARNRVRVTAATCDEVIEIQFEDDGPGIGCTALEQLLERSRRADEAVPGTGIGLTIVEDILIQCGGEIAQFDAPAGGLGVRVTLPAGSA